MRRLTVAFALTMLCAFAQPRDRVEIRRADIRGGGDHGKCTIEVVVDGAADVAIRGDSAELRTLSGQRAEWRRFVCNQPMPFNPSEFRFSGIDGRGRQTLIREPRRGSPAVVRIEDPKGGREGYTFDVEWSGDAGGGYGGRRDEGDRGGERWTGRLGGEFRYRGDGQGILNRRTEHDIPVRDVLVSLDRDGRVTLEFEARGSRRIVFGGQATNIAGGTVQAELTRGGGARGQAVISVDRNGQVIRVNMKGRMDGDPFILEWSAR